MKNLSLLILILLSTVIALGQTREKATPQFDIADFNKKFKDAEWLVRYDYMAWKSTDLVRNQDPKELAKLGREWFCFQDVDKVWHAVYGKFENSRYNLVFHFKMNEASKIVKTEEKVDNEFLNSHAKALFTANKDVADRLKDRDAPRFNQYVRKNADETISVWILPAFQTNGLAVYGAEYIYTLDKNGNKIIKDESYEQENFRGFKSSPRREIWLNYEEVEKPPLGAIFFVWYYKPYFTKINLETSRSISTVIKDEKMGYMWVHVEKQAEDSKKK